MYCNTNVASKEQVFYVLSPALKCMLRIQESQNLTITAGSS